MICLKPLEFIRNYVSKMHFIHCIKYISRPDFYRDDLILFDQLLNELDPNDIHIAFYRFGNSITFPSILFCFFKPKIWPSVGAKSTIPIFCVSVPG